MTDFVPPTNLSQLPLEDRFRRLESLVQHLDRELAKVQKLLGSREDWEKFSRENWGGAQGPF